MIDTLALARKLREAGDSQQHAESVAEAIGEAINERAVTKNDLLLVEQRLDAKITGVETRLEATIAKSTLTLFVGLTSVIAIATALLAAILHR
ncbi:MAG: hypothetical protein ACYDFS_05360 [Vulcanimicrobiaceae bacterium]